MAFKVLQPARLALALMLSSLAAAQSSTSPAAPIDAEIAAGQDALNRQKYPDAKKHFEKAEKLSNKTSVAAYRGLALAAVGARDYKEADRMADRGRLLAANNGERGEFENLGGMAKFEEYLGNPKKIDKLHEAQEQFRRAATLAPAQTSALFNLGVALLKEGRDDEGVAILKDYVAKPPPISSVARARRFIAKPSLARGDLVHDFVAPTPDGGNLQLSSLQGKVVLLDFWATWCGPCVRSIPAIRQLAARFPADKFAILSISIDKDAGQWKSFLAKENPSWAQCRDESFAIYHSVGLGGRGIVAVPSYVLLDRDGMIVHRYFGMDEVSALQGDIRRALENNDEKPGP